MEKDPLTYTVIGCAMKVHNKLGPGFQEVIYARSLAIELRRAGISYVRELELEVNYDDFEVGTRRADFVVENVLTVEIKAKYELEASDLIQAKNYTVVYNYPRGLLINFGSLKLQYKLLFNPKYNNPNYISQKKEEMKKCVPPTIDQGVSQLICPHCGKSILIR